MSRMEEQRKHDTDPLPTASEAAAKIESFVKAIDGVAKAHAPHWVYVLAGERFGQRTEDGSALTTAGGTITGCPGCAMGGLAHALVDSLTANQIIFLLNLMTTLSEEKLMRSLSPTSTGKPN